MKKGKGSGVVASSVVVPFSMMVSKSSVMSVLGAVRFLTAHPSRAEA
jgi:hypothetical protein